MQSIKSHRFPFIIMSDLYFTTTSCGAANYIAAKKAGLIPSKLSANLVNIQTHIVESGKNKGKDFYQINPKGNVPTIVLPDGTVLNENAATLQWIADQVPNTLSPPAGSSNAYLLKAKLSYVSSEVHGTIGHLFNPTISAEVRSYVTARLATKFEFLNKELQGKKFYVGDSFTVVDSYLYIVLSWTPYLKVDLAPYPNVKSYFEGIAALDFIKEAHAEMAKLA